VQVVPVTAPELSLSRLWGGEPPKVHAQPVSVPVITSIPACVRCMVHPHGLLVLADSLDGWCSRLRDCFWTETYGADGRVREVAPLQHTIPPLGLDSVDVPRFW
jgi:hypothetical protein